MTYRDRNGHRGFEGWEGIIALLIVGALVLYSLYELFVGHNITLTNWN